MLLKFYEKQEYTCLGFCYKGCETSSFKLKIYNCRVLARTLTLVVSSKLVYIRTIAFSPVGEHACSRVHLCTIDDLCCVIPKFCLRLKT
jgi:hypothetical protein